MSAEPEQNHFRKARRRLKKGARAALRAMRKQIREQGFYEEPMGNLTTLCVYNETGARFFAETRRKARQ